MKPPFINNERCTSCNKCIDACHTGSIKKIDDKWYFNENDCIGCGHCIAICPVISTVKPAFDKKDFFHLIATRRSIRFYQKDKKLSQETVNLLIDAAAYAPSAGNSQCREFTVITTKQVMNELKEMTANFYESFIKFSNDYVNTKQPDNAAQNKSAFIKKDSLIKIEALINDLKNGRDTLFYDAPCLIIIHADKNSILPQENCCYALYNMIILAHSMGIGSCINGHINFPINFNSKIREKLNIPETNLAYASSTFGYPLYEYQKIPERKTPNVVWL